MTLQAIGREELGADTPEAVEESGSGALAMNGIARAFIFMRLGEQADSILFEQEHLLLPDEIEARAAVQAQEIYEQLIQSAGDARSGYQASFIRGDEVHEAQKRVLEKLFGKCQYDRWTYEPMMVGGDGALIGIRESRKFATEAGVALSQTRLCDREGNIHTVVYRAVPPVSPRENQV